MAVVAGLFGALALGLFANAQSASAFWPWRPKPEPPKPAPYWQIIRQHERRENVWENCDYAAWKERVGDRPIAERIDENNFGEFCEMHRLMLDGKLGEANEIRKELDLPAPRPAVPPHRPHRPWLR